MTQSTNDFQAVQEIGKIYQSLIDRKALAEFYLQTSSALIGAQDGFLYLSGQEDQIWLECSLAPQPEGAEDTVFEKAKQVLQDGKPHLETGVLILPLLVRNSAIGAAAFTRQPDQEPFQQEQMDLALGLGSQAAGALKNIILFEENVKMEKLAAVGQTTGMVLHEIKNIMQLARLSYDFVQRGYKEKKESYLTRGMTNLQRALKELEGFTMDMLSLTKDYALEPAKTSIMEILTTLEDDLKAKAEDMEVALKFDIEPDFPAVDADRGALYRTLLNLVKNAIEASDYEKTDSYVAVRAALKDDTHYTIAIEDNGIGMSQEVKARLFEAFFSTKGKKGTGLGLMIIQRTVKVHQGVVEIESEEGKGTCFTLTLPREIKT